MPSPAPQAPKNGKAITISGGRLSVPDQPILPFIEGDGTGPDIWRASQRVLDAAVEKAYGGRRKLAWMEVYAGIEYAAGTPESQKVLDFWARDFPKEFKKIRFGTREAGAGWQKQLEGIGAPKRETPVEVGVGLKPISYLGTERLVHSAISYAVQNKRKSVTLVHKGNIMKFTEGAFRNWGYQLAKEEFGAKEIGGGPWLAFRNPLTDKDIVVKDVIADNFLQQVLLRPEEYDVIATLNLNGDYVSDALAAQVGGIGIAPGGNIGEGLAVFAATHGTAPGFAGKDRVNPGSLILSAEMMLRYLKWNRAAELIIKGMTHTIANKELTYDLARLREAIKAPKRELAARKNVEEDLQRLIPGARLMSCSGFATAVIRHMDD